MILPASVHLHNDESITFRFGTLEDLTAIMELAWDSWKVYQTELTKEHWNTLSYLLKNEQLFIDLIQSAQTIICESINHQIIGMAFLVPQGNPTSIYQADWSYIRFVSVHPKYNGQGIGTLLMQYCIRLAKQNGEHTIGLHTSEMMQNAIAIYEKLGFKMERTLPESLGKQYWLYLLKLS